MKSSDAVEKKTVLICDDEPHIRESIRYAVNKEGLSYELASDGHAAHAKALSTRPDLIILDVGMPGMTGFEVCEKLRAEPSLSGLKVIILTAFGQSADELRAYEVGADKFIKKPFSPRELRQTLRELLA